MNVPVGNINYSVATGGNSTNPFITILLSRDPTSNDVNYVTTQRWVNIVSGNEWILIGFTSFQGSLQATWINLSSGDTSNVNTITTNTGGEIPPTADNINIVGDGTTITGVGVAGTSTITLSALLPALTWSMQESNFNAVAGNGYIIEEALTAMLPSGNLGDTVAFICHGTNLLTITATNGRGICIGNQRSSIYMNAANTFYGDSITLICTPEWNNIGAPQGVWILS